mgnify:FL=1
MIGAAMAQKTIYDRALDTVRAHKMAGADAFAVAMVSGGSDSCALAYMVADMVAAGELGAAVMLHVNHKLRGEASEGDARFVAKLAEALGLPLFMCEIDVSALVRQGGNMEAIARDERYKAARQAIESTCSHLGFSEDSARVYTAHTADDRVENFYMRSIVGAGPGGFRSMNYCVNIDGMRACHPLLELGRDDLRAFIAGRSCPVRDELGELWREDVTNADTDHFRAFVRHEIVPRAKERNPRLLETLTRTMNLIAEEDDMLAGQARELLLSRVRPLGQLPSEGFLISPDMAHVERPLARRVIDRVLSLALGRDARIETASIETCLDGLGKSGFVSNIQGNLAVSYNKNGLRIEPMDAFRARRKKL